ncbi:MAG: 4-hydroxybenzoate octaprenyltransferase [Rhodospirillaceae bacterium]|nr:MAG: 4-hydroxybenzoate octaprenyltransferase [Rhodospirillaceae bacterium]
MISSAHTDIPVRTWIDHWSPAWARPYLRLMRLDRPIGWWLLLLPGWWSIVLASFGTPRLMPMALFLVGAIVMRGAGCTYNDIVDRDIDVRVARTATRPLPSGQVSLKRAWIFLGVQLLIGLAILAQFNRFAMGVGAASLVLIAVYPFMKRITYWPQAWLGLTFNWGALLGWAAVRGSLDRQAFLLYAAGFFWTLGYDTIYAHQDREDDALAGIKSSARALGRHTRPVLAVFYGLTTALLAAAIGPPIYNPVALVPLALAAFHLGWQVKTLDVASPDNCLRRFKSNRDFGLLILAACWAAWR